MYRKMQPILCWLLFALLLMTMAGCTSTKAPVTEEKTPIVYSTLDEMFFDPNFTVTPADGIILETTLDVSDYVLGILYNPDDSFEFYQWFSAQKVEGGYRLIDSSLKQGSSGLQYGMACDLVDGSYRLYLYPPDVEFKEAVQDLGTKILSNGKEVRIGLECIK